MKERNPWLLAVVETWLDASHSDQEVNISNYNLLRSDRSLEPNRGGIAIYYRNDLDVTLLHLRSHNITCKCENMWLRVKVSECRIFTMGVVYRSPQNINLTEHITADLESIAAMKYPILIVGDFNLDLLGNSSSTSFYRDTMTSFLLHQLLDEPTRVTETSATLIDHVWTSNEELIEESTLLPGLSDHHMCLIKMKLYSKNRKQEDFTSRSFRGLNRELFLGDLQAVDWSFIDILDDIDQVWDEWHKSFMRILDVHAPLKTIKRNKEDSPWMKGEIMNLVRKKMAARISRDNNTNINTVAVYHNYKALVKAKVATAKTDYYRNKVSENKDNPQKMWSIIKEAAPSNFKQKAVLGSTSCDPEAFNEFFVNVGSNPQVNTQDEDMTESLQTLSLTNIQDMELVHTTQQAIQDIIYRFPANKAPGLDDISGKALRLALPALLSPITRLVNRIITTQKIPRELKLAKVTPIFKTGDRNNPSNYRPISVLPLISKVLERTVADQLMNHLETNSLLADAQYGFRKKHSTATCLLQLTEEIRRSLDVKKAVGVVALDLSKAFDSIDHQLLLTKLPSFGIRTNTNTYRFFKNYLEDRRQKVKLDGISSSELKIKTGVPQGSILGPLLFIMFVNDFPRTVLESKCVMYADDTTIYASSRNPSNIEFALNNDLRNANNWYNRNKLKLNIAKTKFMVIYPTNMEERFDSLNIFIQGQHVKRESSIKVLGVHLSEDLKWSKHTASMLRGLKYQYRAFSRSIKYFDTDTRIMVYNSSIASRLNYADCVWTQCNVREEKMLQSVQNMAVRRILNARPLDSAGPLICSLGLLPLEKKRLLRSLVLFYKLVKGDGPKALTNMLNTNFINPSSHGIRTRNSGSGQYFIPSFNTDHMKKSFFIQMIKEWNRLPDEIRSSESASIFKDRMYRRMISAESQPATCPRR